MQLCNTINVASRIDLLHHRQRLSCQRRSYFVVPSIIPGSRLKNVTIGLMLVARTVRASVLPGQIKLLLGVHGPVKVRQFTGALMSFRADEIRGLWFDENLQGACFAEDIDFCARLARNNLLITPRARLVHKRSPEGRNAVHWLDLHAQGANYMRQRHWRRGIWNNLCFAWLNVGYALAATLSSVCRMSLEPWQALRQGARRGRSLGKPQ